MNEEECNKRKQWPVYETTFDTRTRSIEANHDEDDDEYSINFQFQIITKKDNGSYASTSESKSPSNNKSLTEHFSQKQTQSCLKPGYIGCSNHPGFCPCAPTTPSSAPLPPKFPFNKTSINSINSAPNLEYIPFQPNSGHIVSQHEKYKYKKDNEINIKVSTFPKCLSQSIKSITSEAISLDSIQSSISGGNQSFTSVESRFFSPVSSNDSGSEANIVYLLRTHMNTKMNILSPISDKSSVDIGLENHCNVRKLPGNEGNGRKGNVELRMKETRHILSNKLNSRAEGKIQKCKNVKEKTTFIRMIGSRDCFEILIGIFFDFLITT